MSVSQLQHPGVAITERDMSQVTESIAGTYCFVPGYADKGENYEPLIMNSVDDIVAIYGEPTNEAERYFYYAGEEVIRNGGTLVTSKLPYDNVMSNYYRGIGLSFSASGTIISLSSSITNAKARMAGPEVSGYFTHYSLLSNSKLDMTLDHFDALENGAVWSTSLPASASTQDFIIVNTSKDSITGPNANESTFIAIVDLLDGLKAQRLYPIPAYNTSSVFSGEVTNMQAISGITVGGTNYTSGNFNFAMFADLSSDSYSEQMARLFPTIDYDPVNNTINKEYANWIGVLVMKSYTDQYSSGLLNLTIAESYAGSIHKDSRDLSTGNSNYIGDVINNTSTTIKFYAKVDTTDSLQSSNWEKMRDAKGLNDNVVIYFPEKQVYPLLGFTKAESQKWILGQQIGSRLDTALAKVSNIDDVQLDLVVDAGLSTIAQFCSNYSTTGELFNPAIDSDSDAMPITDGNSISYWRDIVSRMISFCRDTRKDCMAILDVPRNLVLDGEAKFIRKSAPTNTFANTIGKNIRFVTGLNSSYAALYSDWMRAVDKFTGVNFWMPQSIKTAGVYCYNDRVANIWDAPAGLNRGVINGINDLSFNPGDKDMDQLYTKGLNYAKKYPLDGFIVEGQKTTQTKPSAFDRVNVRRLFLRLERMTYRAARYFCYEPNNIFTRRRLVDVLKPTFDSIKAQGGIYEYEIICSTVNNTPQTIDQNELNVAIMIQPTRTAEKINITFVATRTGANFSEIIATLG